MDPIERCKSDTVYSNAWMTVREDAIRRPDGSHGIYGVVDKPDYALVIARHDDQYMLVEQFRYPLGLRRWEFPQGTAPERAEIEPADLAARELREETGLTATTMVELGLLDVAPGMSSQRGRAYLALGITEGPPQREHEEQDMRCAWFTREQVESMMRASEITDAQSLAAWTLLGLLDNDT